MTTQPEVGWTVRIIAGPADGQYGTVRPGTRWRWVRVEVEHETEFWVPLAGVELVNKGTE